LAEPAARLTIPKQLWSSITPAMELERLGIHRTCRSEDQYLAI
jgi:hypothetical protein